MSLRPVKRLAKSRPTLEGAGVHLRRAFGFGKTSDFDMKVPSFRLHPFKGTDRGRWSVWVNGNWRLTFEFEDGHAYSLDHEDYH